MNRIQMVMTGVVMALCLQGCAPQVGSERWCANLKEKPKGDWSVNEATDYAKHCLFKSGAGE